MKQISLPGSKSISNRDFILASLCDSVCEISGYLESDDTHYMLSALKSLGIKITEKNGSVLIEGGIEKIRGNDKEIYVHQSGTCMRFLTGFALLNKNGFIVLTGDTRLNERPMGDLLDGMEQMGIQVESNDSYPPIKIFPSQISNNKIMMKGNSSSQYFTALLQVGAFIPGGLEIIVVGDLVSKPYIDLSIEELRKFGIQVENFNYKKFVIKEQKIINPTRLLVEGDASALSYIANFAVLENKKIEISNIGNNSKQGDYGYLDILGKYFGLSFESDGIRTKLDSEHGNILDDSPYREIDFEKMPDVSMSFMSLAPLLSGKTKIVGLHTLNFKESRRIDAMGTELRKLGVHVEYDDDTITISHGFHPPKIVEIESYNDHRITMTFGVLKIFLEKKYDTKINILNPNCVSKTYPLFWETLDNLTHN